MSARPPLLLLLLSMVMVFVLCRQKKPSSPLPPPVVAQADTTIPTQNSPYFSRKPARYYYVYDSKKTEIANFDQGYADTFSIAGTHFRLLSNPDTSNDLEMQVYKHQQWITNFRTMYGFDGNLHEDDINEDGFVDFQQVFRNGTDVFLYNPAAGQFVDTSINMSIENGRLTKQGKLFYEIWQSKDPDWNSDVYRFNGLNKEYLYTLSCIESEHEVNSASSIRVYRCLHGDLHDTVFIRSDKIQPDSYEFDYEAYWRAFVKKHKTNKR